MDIGGTIRDLRKEKGYSQIEFSKLVGITQTALSLIETGVNLPHNSTLKKICKHLKVPEPLLIILSVEKSDVPRNRWWAHELLYPTVKDFMKKIFKEDYQNNG